METGAVSTSDVSISLNLSICYFGQVIPTPQIKVQSCSGVSNRKYLESELYDNRVPGDGAKKQKYS